MLRILASLAVALLALRAHANDWAQWRGPMRDGISAEKNLLPEWPENGPRLLWRADKLGHGYSTPAVVGDHIYLLGSDGLGNEFVVALDSVKGDEHWRQPLGPVGGPDQHPNYPGARSTPTVDSDVLYVLSSDGLLACLDPKSGKPRWQKNVRTELAGKPGEWAYAESPLVDGDLVLCTPGGDEATIAAFDKRTGDVAWKTPIPGEEAGYASIVVAEIAGVKQYVQFLSKGLVGLDAANGKLLWRYDRTATGSLANIVTPVVHNDLVYTAAKSGGGAARITRDGDTWNVEEAYYDSKLPRAIGGAVLVGDYLYGTNSDSLMCVEFKTGDVKWRDRSIAPAAVCYADGRLYLHAETGDVALVEATSEGYQEKGRFTPPNPPDRGSSKAWAYPVVAGGKLYIYDWGTLWCYEVGAE